MSRLWLCGCLAGLVVSALVLPSFAADEKKDEKPAAKEQYAPAGSMMGKLTAVSGDGKSVTVRVFAKVPQYTMTGGNPYQNPGPFGRPQQPSIRVDLKDVHQDFELLLSDDAKIRIPPIPELDEKGIPKPYKPDLKDPDIRLGGMKGTPSSLHPEQWVGVALGRSKDGRTVVTLVYVFGEMQQQ